MDFWRIKRPDYDSDYRDTWINAPWCIPLACRESIAMSAEMLGAVAASSRSSVPRRREGMRTSWKVGRFPGIGTSPYSGR